MCHGCRLWSVEGKCGKRAVRTRDVFDSRKKVKFSAVRHLSRYSLGSARRHVLPETASPRTYRTRGMHRGPQFFRKTPARGACEAGASTGCARSEISSSHDVPLYRPGMYRTGARGYARLRPERIIIVHGPRRCVRIILTDFRLVLTTLLRTLRGYNIFFFSHARVSVRFPDS